MMLSRQEAGGVGAVVTKRCAPTKPPACRAVPGRRVLDWLRVRVGRESAGLQASRRRPIISRLVLLSVAVFVDDDIVVAGELYRLPLPDITYFTNVVDELVTHIIDCR